MPPVHALKPDPTPMANASNAGKVTRYTHDEPSNADLGIEPVSWRVTALITVGGCVVMLAILWGGGTLLLWALRG